MITAMRAIARQLDKSVKTETLRKVMTLHQRIDKVVVLRVKRNEEIWEYDQASIVDYDPDKATQFLYRQGPSNGLGTTPAALITDVDKTFPKKMLAWFNEVPRWRVDVLKEEEILYITDIGNALKQGAARVIKDVNVLLGTIDRTKGNTLLTVLIEEDGKERYIGQLDAFVNLFLELVRQRYYRKYGTSSKGNGVCYVCNDEKIVYGFVTDIFSFYTLDKRGFAPGLHVPDGWKVFPVCFECAIALENTKQFLDDNLLFNFYGAKYYLIPQSVTESDDSLEEVLRVISEQDKKVVLTDASGRLTEDDNEILETASNFSDSIVLNFLFYVMEQSSMRILVYVEDVLPSQISRIFEIKSYLENHGLYYESSVVFNLSILRNIVALNRDAKDFKEFIYVTERLLKHQSVRRELLLDRTLTHLESQRNKWGIGSLMGSASASDGRKRMDNILRSMMLLEFFEFSESDNGGVSRKMSDKKEKTREEIVREIFESHPSFFTTHSQKAAFLIGLLTGRLMAIQQHQRGSAPFEKKLHNLRFTMTRLKRLYLQVESKLKAYGYSQAYGNLEQILSEELLSTTSEKVDNDELSISFVIGLNQSYKFRSSKGDEIE